MSWTDDLAFDRQHLWHPYTSMQNPMPVYGVESASGVRLKLSTGQSVVDGMSSWWCAVHGYNVAELNEAATRQLASMSHVMFGGLTHRPAIELGKRLVRLAPEGVDRVFLCDSGSVSMEVAIKMALQYQQARGHVSRNRLLTIRGGYHGDTFGAMSVCDPINGMHTLFSGAVAKQHFARRPVSRFDGDLDPADLLDVDLLFETSGDEVAAVVVEPIVQGAGGMWFYHPEFLRALRQRCDEHGALLIVDEIAAGFGRTGKFWGVDHAGISPDIMAVGKALTGGYLTMAATMATSHVADTISSGDPGVFMHGPTFMGNPLSSAIACASIDLLESRGWHSDVSRIEQFLTTELGALSSFDSVIDVRVLGAIGVVQVDHVVDVTAAQRVFIEHGAWIRPFRDLIYVMPPYVSTNEDLTVLVSAIRAYLQQGS